MALPDGINGKTLTFGRAGGFDGANIPASSRVVVTAPRNVTHLTSGERLISGDMVRKYVDGVATFDELVPNDAPGLSRYDWTYHVRFEIPGARETQEPFDFVLLDAGPDVVDGDKLTPVPSNIGTPVAVDVLTADDIVNPASDVNAALRGTFGPSVFDTNLAVSLSRTLRVSPPVTQLPALTWSNTSPTGLTHYGVLAASGSNVVLANPLPVRLVNAAPANVAIDQTYWTALNKCNGSGTPAPLMEEMTVSNASQVVLNFNPVTNGILATPGTVELWIDDIPIQVPAGPTNGARVPSNLTLTWPSPASHTIRVSTYLASLNDMWVSSGGTMTATANPGSPRLAVVGDSWVEGALGINTTLGRLLPRYLGIDDAAICAQGGTGYVANAGGANGKTPYGSTDRVAALVANNPTDVVIFGSINDDGKSATAISTAATALYSTLATQLPSARLYVVPAQPGGPTATASAGHVANRDAVRDVALAAPNVRAVIDTTDWLNGTGWSTVRQGDGNRDLYLGADNVHPTLAGHHYFARRLATVLQRWLYV